MPGIAAPSVVELGILASRRATHRSAQIAAPCLCFDDPNGTHFDSLHFMGEFSKPSAVDV